MGDARSGQGSPPVGVTLRRARDTLGLAGAEAAEAAQVEPSVVRMLEERDPVEWAGDSAVLAALRMYARHLGLDAEPLVAQAWHRARSRRQPLAPARVEPLRPGSAYRQAAGRPRRGRMIAVVAIPLLLVAAGVATGLFVTGVTPWDLDGAAPAEDEEPPPEDGEEDGNPGAAEPGDADDADGAGPPGRPPQDTPVQVLDALEDEAVTAAVVEDLEALGYDVVLVDTTLEPWEETAVYYNEGWEAEAQGLQSRDARFPVAGQNELFVDDAGLHVVVGLDWPQ